jgi:hypothetical protein
LEYRIREAAGGRYRWFLMNVLAIRDARGAFARWIATSTDIDIAKRIEERESLLATVSDRLASSIDIATTLNSVKELAVGQLCDWCQIDLIDEDGRFVPAAVASVDPAETDVLAALVGRPVEAQTQDALERIVASGEPVVIGDPHMVATAVASSSAIIVPLSNGESRIGTLWLVFSRDRAISLDDVGFARDFARRAALALEHARLYERERATADALQRAMLPAQLPQLEHVHFSASYSAASETQRVGGDFYDAFALPDGRVAVTIGDVTGHGLEAAVIMGEIRQALRAAAFERAEPSAILDRASRLLVASGRTVFVTAIFGVLDTQTGCFAYATAGHPPPLLFDGKRVIRLPSSGLPIGLREDDGVDFSLTLHAPCTLTFFTDGLIEFARDLDEGERRIEAAIRELSGTDTEHLAAAIMKRVLGPDEATDDIAILTATVDCFPAEVAGEAREWRFLSTDARAAALARREIGELVAQHRPAERYAAELARTGRGARSDRAGRRGGDRTRRYRRRLCAGGGCRRPVRGNRPRPRAPAPADRRRANRIRSRRRRQRARPVQRRGHVLAFVMAADRGKAARTYAAGRAPPQRRTGSARATCPRTSERCAPLDRGGGY